MILYYYNSLKFVEWMRIWSILVKDPGELDKNVHAVFASGEVLKVSVRSSKLLVFFKSSIYLTDFLPKCLSTSIRIVLVLQKNYKDNT